MKYIGAFLCALLLGVIWSEIYASGHTTMRPLYSYTETKMCTVYTVEVPVLYGLWHTQDTVTKC